MQKIFLNNKLLILSTNNENNILPIGYHNFLRLKGAYEKNFIYAIAYLLEPESKGVIIENEDFTALQNQLYQTFLPIEAGGGVVFNEHGAVLMIFRKGKWDLPKGKRDDGEDIAACALREVREETGIQHLEPGEKICITYHAYILKKRWALKCATWYKMTSAGAEALTPQLEEEILEARWVSPNDIPPLLDNTYPAIIEVLKVAGVI